MGHLSDFKICLLLSLLAIVYFGCSASTEKINPVEEKITESVYASGTVKSRGQYQVFAAVSGLVDAVYVSEGDPVKKGDPVMRISGEAAKFNTELAQLTADYAEVAANREKLSQLKTEIELARAKMDHDASLLARQRRLWEQQIGTKQQVEMQELAYKSSVAAWENARLKYADLEKQLDFQSRQSRKNLQLSRSRSGDYTIRSEIDGLVYSVLKEKGEMVAVQTALAIIGKAGEFVIELQVDEYDIAKLVAGQKVLLTMDSYKGQVFEAVLEKIHPIMNERSRTFTVEAGFVNRPSSLFPNLSCEANIVIREKEKALTIPREYLLDEDHVLLENGTKKKVTTGLRDYRKVEITEGLTKNDVLKNPDQ